VENGAGVPVGTPLSDPALVEMISEDPVLRDTKLIAEAWDCDGLNQVGAFPHFGGRWAEWNGRFRDTTRQFIKVWPSLDLSASALGCLGEGRLDLRCGTGGWMAWVQIEPMRHWKPCLVARPTLSP